MLTRLSQIPRAAISEMAGAFGARFLVEKSLAIMQCDKIEVQMFGGHDAERIYRASVAPHRRLRIVGNKTLGVALAQVPVNPDEVFQGKRFHEARRKKNRAIKAGFTVKKRVPAGYYDTVYKINTSAPMRQGRMMDDYMSNKQKVQDFCATSAEIYGVFDRTDALKAYAHGTLCGEVFVLDRFIGDQDVLAHGVMFLLAFEIMIDMAKYRQLHGIPHWVQHDVYFVPNAGARQFKKEVGFVPYRVRWRWNSTGMDAVTLPEATF
jgi:hypothetical protein